MTLQPVARLYALADTFLSITSTLTGPIKTVCPRADPRSPCAACALHVREPWIYNNSHGTPQRHGLAYILWRPRSQVFRVTASILCLFLHLFRADILLTADDAAYHYLWCVLRVALSRAGRSDGPTRLPHTRGRWSHLHAPLYISFMILHREKAGRHGDNFTARGHSPGCCSTRTSAPPLGCSSGCGSR
jgi:hypothetical protein